MNPEAKRILEEFREGKLNKAAALELLMSAKTGNGSETGAIQAREALTIQLPRAATASPNGTIAASNGTAELEALVKEELANLLSHQLKVDRADLDSDTPLDEYGLDSIMLNDVAAKLEDLWKLEITAADLVDQNTLGGWARFFAGEFEEALRNIYENRLIPRRAAPENEAPLASPLLVRDELSSARAEARPLEQIPPVTPARQPLVIDHLPAARTEAVYPPIAIIGMSGAFPKSPDLAAFWAHLVAGRDLISEIPEQRKAFWAGFEGLAEELKTHQPRWAGLMDGIDQFDARFFSISPKEAESMDPQQRMALQTVWHTVEDAGYKASDLAGRAVGLFFGAAAHDYAQLSIRQRQTVEAYNSTGCNHCVLVNRISFFFNWRGPSEPVDTACSSSLVAVHRAIKAIHDGDCELAIAGGVSAVLSPLAFVAFSKAGMLSPEGRCKAFDSRADGYVRGEGVGAIFLKPLERAIADGDQIYGVIRGSAINHCGDSGSLTSPRAGAQAECIATAHERAGLDPATITYIEAHGTGTKLGDPVEFEGLKLAFAEIHQRRGQPQTQEGYCGLGSVKTNIGHLEGAAGIAGLLKVLLALRHKTLPPLLHFQELNPAIHAAHSPFYLVRQPTAWNALRDAAGKAIPRRAGVNSFGFGGVNAHVVIEEFSAPGPALKTSGPQLVVLSAKNPDRLREYASNLKSHLEGNPDLPLDALAYTSQIGREEFAERLAIVADSTANLLDGLKSFLDGSKNSAVFRGRKKDAMAAQAAGVVNRDELLRLAASWVGGGVIDWHPLHPDKNLRRSPLPVYPFERKSYWFTEEAPAAHAAPRLAPVAKIHGMISLASTEDGVFTGVLTGSEFFLRDHQVAGQPVLPGVAYLELARVAAEALFKESAAAPLVGLKNVVWLQPIVFSGKPLSLEIRFKQGPGSWAFQIFTKTGPESSPTLHSQGRAIQATAPEPTAAERLDFRAIQNRCRFHLSKSDFYQKAKALGFGYGPAFVLVEELWAHPGEALARIQLPEAVGGTLREFGLHPSILDGALQALSGLGLGNEENFGLQLPFALGAIKWFAPLERECYAYSVPANSEQNDVNLRKYHVRILDREGRTLVLFENFMARSFAGDAKARPAPSATPEQGQGAPVLFAVPQWIDSAISAPSVPAGPILVFADEPQETPAGFKDAVFVRPGGSFQRINERLFQIAPKDPEDYASLFAALEKEQQLPRAIFHCWSLASSSLEGVEQLQERGIFSMFHLVQQFLQRAPKSPLRLLCFYPAGQPIFETMSGFARSVRMEHPNCCCATIGLPEASRPLEIGLGELAELENNSTARGPVDCEVQYSGGRRQIRKFFEIDAAPAVASPFRKNAVYLITGGMGGLGLMFARHWASRHAARLVLTGRSSQSAQIEQTLAELKRLGGDALYIPADISKLGDARALIEQTKKQFGRIDGILHAAGVLHDGALLKKSFSAFQQVLAPKIQGALNLDEATRAEALDFFVLFSSLVSVTGNRGQTDYAAANRFLDGFAAWRESQRRAGRRTGRTLSVNWPLWANGGMRMPPALAARMRQATGMAPLEDAAGLAAFETVLAMNHSQIVVMSGDKDKLRQIASLTPQPKPSNQSPAHAGDPEEQVLATLKTTLCEALKVDPGDLDPETPLEEYGVDSIAAMDILKRLEDQLSITVDPSSMMEYPTMRALARHLAGSLPQSEPAAEPKASALAASPRIEIVSEKSNGRPARTVAELTMTMSEQSAPPARRMARQQIAVISMACRFPKSPSLEAFWENLAAGKNLIREVPAERWALEAFYHPDKAAPKKSYSKWGAYLDQFDWFDADFFGIDELTARGMDPQHRLILELSQELFDRAGFGKDDLRKTRTGIFIGGGQTSYLQQHYDLVTDADLQRAIVNNAPNMMAARISDFYDLHGPACTIDTACSSSLVAIHAACQSLSSGESEMAVAGGVELLTDPSVHVMFSKAGVLTDDGVARVFDRKSKGFVLGEGAGLVLLKPLEAALRDGDPIAGIILGSAINNDGHTMGLTTPNLNAQMEVIELAHKKAGIHPNSLTYLEAHGTGTLLGDPIEIKAATQVFRKTAPDRQYCAVGSVKSNMGHLLRAAGVASFIKVVLALGHRQIPPTLHCDEPHPRFRFQESPFYPVRELRAWEPRDGFRRAAISSFGFGGTNCHVILEEFDPGKNGYQQSRWPKPSTQFKRKRFSLRALAEPSAAVVAKPSQPAPIVRDVQPSAPPRARTPVALLEVSSETLQTAIESFLADELAQATRKDAGAIEHDLNFMELGVDSFAMVEMAQRLELTTGIELYPTLFFEHQNIEALARYFATEHRERFSAFLKLSPAAQVASPNLLQATPPSAPEELLPEPVVAPSNGASRIESAAPSSPRLMRPAPVERETRDIAIIGLGGRFAESANPEEFWAHLKDGADLIREIPPNHFDYRPSYDPRPQAPGKTYCKWGSFIRDVDRFDAGFFRIPTREAELMDPQMRLLLEVIHATAEDAGYGGRIRGSRTGMYIGVCFHDYATEMARFGKPVEPFDGTGNATTMMANRPSYVWDLRGPSLALDTACSSSLVALHLACQALRNGECEMAFAGGTNLLLGADHYVYFCSIGALSPTGRCHSFDKSADGYVPGEAVACVLLKPLANAIRDGDPIHAVIKGSAVNHGGYTNSVTAPSPKLEAEVILQAWKDAGISPETISYLEAHGTGTKLGDPVEIGGIKMAFKEFTNKKEFCAVGSAKAHIGHAEGAAGIAGVIKTVLSMKHRQIPAMPRFTEINPLIQLQGSPLYINRSLQEWNSPDGQPLRAGVSSFGFGGTYAHVVLESFPQASANPEVEPGSPQLFLFSGKTESRLKAIAAQFVQWLDDPSHKNISLVDVAHTLRIGREAMDQRLAVVARDRAALRNKLHAFATSSATGEGCWRGAADKNASLQLGKGAEDQRYFLDLWQNGQWNKLGALWANGADIGWNALSAGASCKSVSLPCYPFEPRRYWFREVPDAVANDLNTVSASLPQPPAAPASPVVPIVTENSPPSMRDFLLDQIARLLDVAPAEINPESQLEELGLDSIKAMQLLKEIQDAYGLSVYANEIQSQATLHALADYLENQAATARGVLPDNSQTVVAPPPKTTVAPTPEPAKAIGSGIVFLLSTPRAGSTLLRVMLAGHSKLFCPPELHLLPFDSLKSRAETLAGGAKFLSEGLVRAVMELKSAGAEQAREILADLQLKNFSTARIYEWLHATAGGRMLVDKSPSYGRDLAILQRAKELFPHARYIFLTRHPGAVIESFVRNRFEKLLGLGSADPSKTAEEIWKQINANITAFLGTVAENQQLQIQYEQLVGEPELVARRICDFLEIEFQPALLNPYEGSRMTDGPHSVSVSIGDPNFLSHKAIEPSLARRWEDKSSDRPALEPDTIRLAAELGYSIGGPASNGIGHESLSPAQNIFLANYGTQPEWYLQHRIRFHVDGELNLDRLRNAWRRVIERHDQLRVSFIRSQAAPHFNPVVLPSGEDIEFGWADLSQLSDVDQETAVMAELAKMQTAIDPARWPLARIKVASLRQATHELLLVSHHLIGDGFSSGILLKQLFQCYAAPDAALPAVTFQAYLQAVAELAAKSSPGQVEFLNGRNPSTVLPFDKNCACPSFDSEEEIEFLRDSAPPAFELLAASLYRALSDWTKDPRPVIAHRWHGRAVGQQKFFTTVGCFAFDVPLGITCRENRSDTAAVFSAAFNQMAAQAIPYGWHAAAGNLPHAHQLASVRLNYQPQAEPLRIDGIREVQRSVRPAQRQDHPRPYPLDLIVRPGNQSFVVLARFSRNQFEPETIRQFVGRWIDAAQRKE